MASLKSNKPLVAKTALKAKSVLKANKKPKKQKLPSITILRRRADKIFSQAVRLRDGKLRGDGNYWSQCITCGKWNLTSKTHAGHFIQRDKNATRFDEENVNAICEDCNYFEYAGNENPKYAREINLKYGDGTVSKLKKMSKVNYQFTEEELKQVIQDSQEQIRWYKAQNV